MDNTIIQQGRFTSDGSARTISLRSDVDWMKVINFTQMSAQNNVGVEYWWQRGFAQGTGIRYFKSGGGNTLNALNLASPDGFTLVDTSGNPVGNSIAVTATTNAAQPVVSTGNTGNMEPGSVVRLINITGVPNLGGIDFEVGTVVVNTSFTIRYALANAPGAVGTGGAYRQINFDPIYYPRRRFLANVTQAAQAVVTLTVTHGYTVGQEVRFRVPAEYSMVELDGVAATILAVDTAANTITIDVDTSAFTAFTFPVVADYPFTPAQVVPLGEDTGEALSAGADILADATDNEAILGMILSGGASSPAGANNDVMYWVAGKSFSVDNQ